ncbi:ArsR family transcriptional regulator [Tamilnaduibacter salinus]|uniref:ArsR family transcriptional regulator n=1 Tax=Tamilnaduibacter salinus TaxID=1484056 RepID=A0A2A2I1B7_9GAMM|nr:metalloregulator ArsR/SmtB family transcription factor [Tamilnaduibacter salinus]PAV25821.1 ArsR family transcriptional regulator [Tamilnaduibacter salinus]
MTQNAPDTRLNSLAPVFKASGDPLRLEILRVLERDTFGVLELSHIFDMRQSGMSHHLKVLSRAGLLEAQREGNAIFYRRPLHGRDDSTSGAAVRQVFELVDRMPLAKERRDRIDAIRKQRADQSQAFFARHADQFREQQELIAAFDRYAGPVTRLLRDHPDRTGWQRALEIGPGEGAFLDTLSELCTSVTALDNSSDMLSRSEESCRQAGLDNVDFVLGSTDALAPDATTSYDLIVANMVLHHVASPAAILSDSARLLAGGGTLIVSDLCRHDQNWARNACGDLWLGFEPEELTAWAGDAGLDAGETLFIGLRNGFQIQVREFRKPSHTAAQSFLDAHIAQTQQKG